MMEYNGEHVHDGIYDEKSGHYKCQCGDEWVWYPNGPDDPGDFELVEENISG